MTNTDKIQIQKAKIRKYKKYFFSVMYIGGKVDWQCGDITDDRAAIFATKDALYIECDLIIIIIRTFVTEAK